MAEASEWAAAKFKGVVASEPRAFGLVVLANNDLVQLNSRGGKPMRVADKEYTRGLYCHAPSKLIVRLPGPGARFTAVAGVDSNDNTSGRLRGAENQPASAPAPRQGISSGQKRARHFAHLPGSAAHAKPVKVFTDSDLPTPSTPDVPVGSATAPADAKATGQAGDAKSAAAKEGESDPEKEREKAVQEWRTKLEDARKEEQAYKDLADRIQLDLNDTSSLYTPGRARKMTTLDETKQKLADVQARIAALEEDGRRAGYR